MKVFKILASIAILGLLSFTTHTAVSSLIWKNETMEIGEIPQGTPKEIIFECKNTGVKQVLISNVKPSCGCTAADYTKEAIAPGKSGFIKATYNAAAAGNFSKAITVTTTDSETPKVLTFKGTVKTK